MEHGYQRRIRAACARPVRRAVERPGAFFMKIQSIASLISISLAFGLVTQAQAADRAGATDGFYGGVSVRDNASSGVGMSFGSSASAIGLNRYPTTVGDELATRSLAFGGYRWHNDLAVEASVSSLDQYALRPLDPANARRGIGLRFGAGAGDVASRSVNVDVVTSWTFYKSMALYGRLGYAQTEGAQFAGAAPLSIVANHGLRDGMNYGVGLRYDMNSTLGLRVEYSRFGRFAGEFGTSLPESDQVTLGVQFRF
jgi:hypothetical protein